MGAGHASWVAGTPESSHASIGHEIVRDVVAEYLRVADAELPGFVEGLYLVGSVALGDFRAHSSDIDFVAVVASLPSGEAVDALTRVHERVRGSHRRPFFDGTYVTWEDLRHDPCFSKEGPHAHEGRLKSTGQAERHPVTWHTLAHHGVTVRGPQPETVPIWTNTNALVSWVGRNLETYWCRWRNRSLAVMSRNGIVALSGRAAVWGVLGISRLHFTLATGQITSKDGAGVYAFDAFGGRWHRLIRECLRIRRGTSHRPLYLSPFARRRDLLDFMQMVIDDAGVTGT